ncbi:MAG: hypothetical protein AVDCRST_MAG64-1739, partial [uncultured Phycisphaerae bacterium]
ASHGQTPARRAVARAPVACAPAPPGDDPSGPDRDPGGRPAGPPIGYGRPGHSRLGGAERSRPRVGRLPDHARTLRGAAGERPTLRRADHGAGGRRPAGRHRLPAARRGADRPARVGGPHRVRPV